jgi:thioredoxin reductase
VVNVTYVEKGGTYMEKSVVVNGGQNVIVNVAEYMANVTNQVDQNLSQSAASDEVKELVKKLAKQIEEIALKIDPNQTRQLGDDLRTLSDEMAKPEPRRKWYELSLDGIKDAAIAVGEIAKPIVATVHTLAGLFGF